MNYIRVIPRDLFNEAKLLKCLGMLALYIHDHKDFVHDYVEMVNTQYYDDFKVRMDEDGDIYVTNLLVKRKSDDSEIHLCHGCNSRVVNSLQFRSPDCEVMDYVFDDDGEFTEAFLNYMKG